jgi:hypothetical protein
MKRRIVMRSYSHLTMKKRLTRSTKGWAAMPPTPAAQAPEDKLTTKVQNDYKLMKRGPK